MPLAFRIPTPLLADPDVSKVMKALWDPDAPLPKALDVKRPFNLCIALGGYTGIVEKLLRAAESFLTTHGVHALEGQWDGVAFALVRVAVFVRCAALDKAQPPALLARAEAFGDRVLKTLGVICVLRYAQLVALPIVAAHLNDTSPATVERRLWQALEQRWKGSITDWGERISNTLCAVRTFPAPVVAYLLTCLWRSRPRSGSGAFYFV